MLVVAFATEFQRDHGNTSEGEREEIEIGVNLLHRVDTTGIDLKQAAAADYPYHEDEICAWSAFSGREFLAWTRSGFSFPGVLIQATSHLIVPNAL